jgi:hypothetical protein
MSGRSPADEPPEPSRPHLARQTRDWRLPDRLPARVAAVRPRIAYTIAGILAGCLFVMGWGVLASNEPVPGWLFVAGGCVSLVLGWRWTRAGFWVRADSVVVEHMLYRRTIPRAEVDRFAVVLRSTAHRLGVQLRDGSTTLMPLGEDLLIPAADLALALNALYGRE